MNSEFGMRNSELFVDNAAHRLHCHGQDFPCDRDIEAVARWREYVLLLSSDTDCLSLWDAEGLVRTARVGVYPQDMALQGDTAYVCGGADGRVHALSLPELHGAASYPVPGMPERICIHGSAAWLLTLTADYDVHTALLRLDPATGRYTELAQYRGLPGAIAPDQEGLWVGVSEAVLHLPWGAAQPDTVFDGFGLARRIDALDGAVTVTDPLEGKITRITQKPRPAAEVLYRGEVGHCLLF